MDDGRLSSALDRAEQAVARIERALASRPSSIEPDSELREKVRQAVAQLDELIREAAG